MKAHVAGRVRIILREPCVTEPAANHDRLPRPRQLQVAGFHAQRKCDPSGYLMMTSTFGQVFEGSINSQYQITGQVTGYCTYDLTFQKRS